MTDEIQVIRQRPWTEAELTAAGFRYYERRKQVLLARELPEEEAPKIIEASWDTLVAEAGAMICYNPGYSKQSMLDDYEHWPVQPDLFEATYRPWDEPDRTPTPAEMHLLAEGCRPYFKAVGAWAKKLAKPHYVQSIESPKPVLIPAGAWLLVGIKGEPWSSTDQEFRSRYLIPKDDPNYNSDSAGA